MRETDGWEVLSDDATVWVNDPCGVNRARYSARLRFMDLHQDFETQSSTGEQCLDCRPATWEDFVASVERELGVVVGPEHKPSAYERPPLLVFGGPGQ